jgi:hypothetical protein
MKTSLAVGALGLVVAAGCAGADHGGAEPTGSTASAIQGGMNDTTHSFTVGIVVLMPGNMIAFCSGALLAPNLVATARHCAAAISSTNIDCSTATFMADFPTSNILVTNEPVINMNASFLPVTQIITPTAAGVCGDDLALLILGANVDLPQYVTPTINPPMTDHSTYAEAITAIGYGITSPTDTTGNTAGTRRIVENVPLNCIPNDNTFTNCYPKYSGIVMPSEFQVSGGTCEGDSGSSAFDQKSFDQGIWESFGVLSRGAVSSDGTTCTEAVYTRFDAYGQLLIDTAKQAAQQGGYPAPTWAGGPGISLPSSSTGSTGTTSGSSGTSSGSGSTGSTAGRASSGASSSTSSSTGGATAGGNGASCTANNQCSSNNCVTADGTTFFCASSCTTDFDCPMGFACEQNYCIASAGNSAQSGQDGGKSGCTIGALGSPTEPVPWRSLAGALVAGALVVQRRSRGPGRRR